jgi:uncharacterized protein YkwD
MKDTFTKLSITGCLMLVLTTIARTQSTPPNLTSDIAWSPASFSTVADIAAAFNNARTGETAQLPGQPYYPFPTMTLPSQSTWDAMTNSAKALWLINAERSARNVLPLEGVDGNVVSVAQGHANYLLTNNLFDHTGSGGTTPWQRLDANAAINGHHDVLSVAENLYASVTSGSSIAMPVERAVYGWIYADASSSWGHRIACLFGPFTNNYGVVGSEGFMGIGRASGGPWSGFGTPWNFAEIIVFNVFDPDASYGGPLPVQLSSFTGTFIAANQVRLQWTTVSEVNNYGFYVERQRRGESQFVEVPNSFIAGHGTTNQPHDYSFTHANVGGGSWQYRLKQVDLDGTEHFTEPITVSSPTSVKEIAPIEFALEQNYPNPFNPSTKIKFSIPVGTGHAPSVLKVFDVLGREVATLVNENLSAGSYETTFDATGLTSGVYFYRLKAGELTQTKRLLLLR